MRPKRGKLIFAEDPYANYYEHEQSQEYLESSPYSSETVAAEEEPSLAGFMRYLSSGVSSGMKSCSMKHCYIFFSLQCSCTRVARVFIRS